MEFDFETYLTSPQVEIATFSYEVISYVLEALALWFMFKKAGEKPWKALIPVYNIYVLYKICWKPSMFWCTYGVMLLGLIIMTFPFVLSMQNAIMILIGEVLYIVGGIMRAVLWYNVSLAYGHGWGYFFGLFFFHPIFLLVIGLGSSQYIGNRYEQAQAS